MRTYKETRSITVSAVRDMCVRNGLYTCGDGEAYKRMLAKVAEKWTVDVDRLASIAEDIAAHSDEVDVTDVMTLLANEAVRYSYRFIGTKE